MSSFCGDFQSGAGIPLLSIQAEEWNMTLNGVNEAGNLNVLMLGLGGLIWNAPCAFWGRLPVLFWTQLLGTFMQLGSYVIVSLSPRVVADSLVQLPFARLQHLLCVPTAHERLFDCWPDHRSSLHQGSVTRLAMTRSEADRRARRHVLLPVSRGGLAAGLSATDAQL